MIPAGRWIVSGLAVRDSIVHARVVGDLSVYGVRAVGRSASWLANHGRADRRQVAAETIIGNGLFHSPDDRKRALSQLAADFGKLATDLAAQTDMAAPWILIDVRPTLDEWLAFHDHELGSWTARFATDWSEYEQWHERLKRLRELARAHGMALASAEPIDLPETIWEQGAQGRGGTVSVLVTLLKVAIFAAIGITGFVALYAVFRDIRGHGRSLTA